MRHDILSHENCTIEARKENILTYLQPMHLKGVRAAQVAQTLASPDSKRHGRCQAFSHNSEEVLIIPEKFHPSL